MTDDTGLLFMFEAIELRNAYDRQIKLLEQLAEGDSAKRERLYSAREDEDRVPSPGFDPRQLEESLKKLKTRRVKLNQAIQKVNLNYEIESEGERISLAEALEIRKNLLSDVAAQSQRVTASAYRRVIHKEGRDIIQEPKMSFHDAYAEYQSTLRRLRRMTVAIHRSNHAVTIQFRDEPEID